MGIFDPFLDSLSDRKDEAAAKSRALLSQTLEFLQEKKEGLNDLLDGFDAKGMGDKVKSWVGPGSNVALTADEVRDALGKDKLEALALRSKLSVEEVTSKLAVELPKLVDKLTPDGEMPKVDLEQHLKNLMAKFDKH